MLTSCTSSEEENIPYLRKLAQKIWYSDLAICENIVPTVSSLVWSLIPLKKLFKSLCWRVLLQFLLGKMKGWKITNKSPAFRPGWIYILAKHIDGLKKQGAIKLILTSLISFFLSSFHALITLSITISLFFFNLADLDRQLMC